MIVYKASDGTILPQDRGFDNPVTKVRFPAGWFASATDADLAAQGITKEIVADPPPPPFAPPVPQAPSTLYSASAFRSLFTPAELAALTTKAQTNSSVDAFLSSINAAGSVDLTSAFIIDGIRMLTNLNPVIISMGRAAQILSGQPPY